MSLGRHRGVALIGRPLDISVQAILDAQEDIASVCVDADVFFADNKIDKSRFRVTAEKTGATGQDALVRIRTTALVDEPVVTVYLRVGCLQKTEKRFVLLADLVSESASSPAASQMPAAAPARPPMVTATPAPAAAPAGSAGTEANPANLPAVGAPSAAVPRRARIRAPAAASPPTSAGVDPAASARPIVEATPSPSRRQRAKEARDAQAAARGSARLKLEPLDLTIDRDPTLRSSSEMLSVPAATPEGRSAAAALWRALTAQPEDLLKDAEKLQSLETSVRNLQVQSQKNQLMIETLTGQVQKAESERYANTLVYALGALLLLALAALAYFLRSWLLLRGGDEGDLPWWRKNEPLEKGWANSSPKVEVSSVPGEGSEARKPVRKQKAVEPPASSVLDLDLGVTDSGFIEVKHLSSRGSDSLPPLPRSDRSDFAMSMTHPARAVKAEELFDVQQQADFFVSLGQQEQAVEVLRSHITDNAQTSALVYLDLFNLYHQLGREVDYEELRATFNDLFNSQIPPFSLYRDKDKDAGPGLEAYQVAMSRIEALWPSPKVLDIIEESIFRKPDAGSEAFDLEAYRELLLLYSVARDIIHPEAMSTNSIPKFDLPDSTFGNEAKTSRFASTSIQPLSASVLGSGSDSRPFLDSVLPPSSPHLGLDLDLSELESEDDDASGEESDSKFFEQFAADIALPSVADIPQDASVPDLPEALDNSIDFESYDSSIDGMGKPKKPGRL